MEEEILDDIEEDISKSKRYSKLALVFSISGFGLLVFLVGYFINNTESEMHTSTLFRWFNLVPVLTIIGLAFSIMSYRKKENWKWKFISLMLLAILIIVLVGSVSVAYYVDNVQ